LHTNVSHGQVAGPDNATRYHTEMALAAARFIEADLGIPQLIEQVQQLPDEIRRQQAAVQAARQTVDEAREVLELMEAALMSEISAAVDPRTGKPAFSNEAARKAELARRKAANEEYQAAARQLAEAEATLAAAQADLDLLCNRFSAARSLVNLQAARLNLIGGDH